MNTLKIFAAIVLILCAGIFWKEPAPADEASKVKDRYLLYCAAFAAAAKKFETAFVDANEKKMQTAFLQLRLAYKKTETIAEYYFPFYAGKLNGPPIPFFEETEADVPENIPYGLQVIEGLLFPHYTASSKKELAMQVEELVRRAAELPEINESFAITDAAVFEAFMEEIYRVTALGVTGFDSQTAQYSLTESDAVIESLQQYTACYKKMFDEKLPGSYTKLQKYFTAARQYLANNKNFISFNRMYFITNFLNPIAKILGSFRNVYEHTDNRAGYYYSAINKNNTLFTDGAFNAGRFLDDFSTSAEKITLGKMLFFDNQLSADNSRSCASCHQPGKAFTDGLQTSLALDGHTRLPRNAPTIWNAALQRNLFADSRSRNLEEQVMQVLNNNNEMHGSAQQAAEKIISTQLYQPVYNKAFPAAKQQDAAQNICNAIACYERTLISLNSRFDKHMNGNTQLTANEINGFNIFMGKAKCGTCHFMPLFGGAKPPRYYYTESEVIGVPANKNKKNAVLDKDSGRYNYTGYNIHLFSFKTPSVRNAAVTAPYMHNGVYSTLEEVIDFYDKGGGKGLGIAPKNQSLPFDKLQLTAKEKKDLVLFIQSLTDTAAAY